MDGQYTEDYGPGNGGTGNILNTLGSVWRDGQNTEDHRVGMEGRAIH